jgi:hypothetical protein
MSPDVEQDRKQADAYLDRLPAARLSAVRSLLETMLPDPVSRALANALLEDEEISEDREPGCRALQRVVQKQSGHFPG